MNYRIEKMYTVSETIDEWGRLGSVVGYYSTKDKAETAAEGKGWYGGKGSIHEAYVIVLSDGTRFKLADRKPFNIDLDVDLVKRKNELIESGLAKLTAAEREALGVNGKDGETVEFEVDEAPLDNDVR